MKCSFPRVFVAVMICLTGVSFAQAQPLTRQPNTTLKLPADLVGNTLYTGEDILPSLPPFARPVGIASAPGETNRLFVIEKDSGIIYVITDFNTATPKKEVFLNINEMIVARGDRFVVQVEWGVLGMAFHPDFAKNGYFYVAYNFVGADQPAPARGAGRGGGGQQKGYDRLSRFKVSATNRNQADPASEFPLITQIDDQNNHNGATVAFGPDGYLYYSMGDEGAANDSYDNARFIDKDFFAGIFRIDVDKKTGSVEPNPHTQESTAYPSAVHSGAYKIPADNPFIGATSYRSRPVDPKKVRTEFWATGLRDPWRFSFDPGTGRMFIGDVGQDVSEEVNIGVKGGDYGWSYIEGSRFDGPANRIETRPQGFKAIDPIYEYPRTNAAAGGRGATDPVIAAGRQWASTVPQNFHGQSITGGEVYRGKKLTELYGVYIFGDYQTSRIWGLREGADGKWSVFMLANAAQMSTFGVDPRDGEVLVANYAGGRIYRLVRQDASAVTDPPKLLSETGVFSDVKAMTPNAGIVAYQPKVPYWSDYASKSQWFSVPKVEDKITFDREGRWNFPKGTVWVQNFDLETRRGDPTSKRRLETRILVKTETGAYGVSYKWKTDGSDAEIVPETGADEEIQVQADGATKTQKWHFPGRGECMLCHSPVAGPALGFNTRQLNGTAAFSGRTTANQIMAMSSAGYFTEPVQNTASLPALVNPSDTTANLEARVRSYLAANCVQCHQPGGLSVNPWDARPSTPLEQANLIDAKVTNDGGDPENRWAKPGDPAHSMVLKRILGKGNLLKMPPISTNEVDPAAAALITEWINKMPR